MFWPDPTHQPTQPPTQPPNHTPNHEWGILHRFQIFKRNWNILISSSVIEFLLFLGVHPLRGVADGCMGVGVGMGVWGVSHAHIHTHMHAHACTHACTCMLNMLIMLNMDASMSAAIYNFYTCIHVCTYVCMCVRVWGTPPPCPQMPLTPPPPTCPLPRAAGSPKQQNSISPELIEIIRFCLKILYLWTFLNSYRL